MYPPESALERAGVDHKKNILAVLAMPEAFIVYPKSEFEAIKVGLLPLEENEVESLKGEGVIVADARDVSLSQKATINYLRNLGPSESAANGPAGSHYRMAVEPWLCVMKRCGAEITNAPEVERNAHRSLIKGLFEEEYADKLSQSGISLERDYEWTNKWTVPETWRMKPVKKIEQRLQMTEADMVDDYTDAERNMAKEVRNIVIGEGLYAYQADISAEKALQSIGGKVDRYIENVMNAVGNEQSQEYNQPDPEGLGGILGASFVIEQALGEELEAIKKSRDSNKSIEPSL